MKNSKSLITALFVLLFLAPLMAQTDNNSRKEIGVKYGTSFTSINESRYSNLTKKYVQPKYGLYFSKWNNRKRTELMFNYFMTMNVEDPENLWYKIIHPEVLYTYQRKVKNNYIGGYFHSSTLLNFPRNDEGLFGNNPISYTIAHSLGFAINRTENLIENENHRLSLEASAKVALLNHLIRPMYAHPYPEHFFQEDVFNPTREGLEDSIHRSGKITTLNKYQNIKFSLGLNYFLKERVRVGIQYQGNFQRVNLGKPSTYLAHDLMLGMGFIFGKKK